MSQPKRSHRPLGRLPHTSVIVTNARRPPSLILDIFPPLCSLYVHDAHAAARPGRTLRPHHRRAVQGHCRGAAGRPSASANHYSHLDQAAPNGRALRHTRCPGPGRRPSFTRGRPPPSHVRFRHSGGTQNPSPISATCRRQKAPASAAHLRLACPVDPGSRLLPQSIAPFPIRARNRNAALRRAADSSDAGPPLPYARHPPAQMETDPRWPIRSHGPRRLSQPRCRERATHAFGCASAPAAGHRSEASRRPNARLHPVR